jgi:hypothetical protein
MHKVLKKLTAESGAWRTSGFTADCGMGSVYTAEGLQGAGGTERRKRGSEWAEAEAAVGDLLGSGRRSTWIDRHRRGDKRSPRE